jgi:hypothetical protein
LLALHDMQHRTMFSRVTIAASLTMCSHDGCPPRVSGWNAEGDAAVNAVCVARQHFLFKRRGDFPAVHRVNLHAGA